MFAVVAIGAMATPAGAVVLSINPSTVNFGLTYVAHQNTVREVVVRNFAASGAPISISILNSGLTPAEPQFVQTNNCGSSLAPGQAAQYG
jgi:hypothetical protein